MLDSGHTHTHTQKVVPFGLVILSSSPSHNSGSSQGHRKVYVCFSGSKIFNGQMNTAPRECYLRLLQQVVDFMEHNYNAWFRRFYSHFLLVYEIGVVSRHKARLIRDTPLNKPVHFLISAQFFRVACHRRRCRRRHCCQT